MYLARRSAAFGLLIACLVTLSCGGQDGTVLPDSEYRVWTTAKGVRSSTKLRAVAMGANRVKLQREDDGQFVELPLSQLSRDDLNYLRDLRRGALASAAPASGAGEVAAIAEGDWPRWRGPNNDGISTETGLLESWPEQGPPLLWSADGIGRGYSSVAVWDGRIYTLGNERGTKLFCLSADGGQKLWEAPVGRGSDPNCTPTVDPDAKLAFAISHGGDLACVDAVSGAVKWTKNFGDDFGGRMMSGWGYSESPLVDGPRLICTPGSDRAVMAALDKHTGDVIWTAAMPGGSAGYASPVISHAGGVKQYVTLVGQGLIGVDADSGKLLWHYKRIANGTANVPTPIVHGDYVFGSSGYGDGGSALLRIQKQGGGVGYQEVYYKRNSELQNHHGGMIRIGDHLYMGDGHNRGFPVCVELESGRALWGPQRGPGSGSAAIAAADGKLYFRYENGVMALIDASPDSFQLRGQFRIKSNHGKSWPHPVIAGKKLYLRDQHELHCYDLAAR